MSGPGLARHPAVPLTSGVSTYPHNHAATRFTGWTTRHEPLITVDLLPPVRACSGKETL
jgi:hypothetical protein